MSPARTLSDLLKDANSPYGRLIERSRLHRELQSRLESVLGPEVAGHYQIQNLREGVLFLQADGSSWAARLRFELPRLLERLRTTRSLQQLCDIQIRVVATSQPPLHSSHRARLSSHAAAILDEAAESTPDPQMREALRRLASRGKG